MTDQTYKHLWHPAAQPQGGPYLSVTSPLDAAGMTIRPQAGERLLIGREGMVTADASGLSRRHAWLEYDGSTLFIEDAGSTNGTVVNLRPVTARTPLRVGDEVRLGEFVATVHDPAALAAPSEVTSGARPALRDAGPARLAHATGPTRYLCAAVHTDPSFRAHVLNEVVEEPFRFVAPSYGVDLVALAAHALSARRRQLLRDAVLTVLLAGLLWIMSGMAAGSDDGGQQAEGSAWVAVAAVLTAGWLVVALDKAWVGRTVLAGALARHDASVRTPHLRAGRRMRSRLEELAGVHTGNVTVFTDYWPFVGSGVVFDRWSFAYDIGKGVQDTKTGQRRSPEPFTVRELYERLAEDLAGSGIPGLTVAERLFVHGRDVGLFSQLLPDPFHRPRSQCAPELLGDVIEDNRTSARTYLCIQASGWHGQLITTLFLRIVRLRESLYVEATSSALLPLARKLSRLDRVPRNPTDITLDAMAAATRTFLPELLAAPVRALTGATGPIAAGRRRRDQRRRIQEGTFDYGATTSVRERAAGQEFYRYFLEYDRDMHDKVIQERLLRHIERFLERKGIDLGTFQMTINNNKFNNSVVNQGENYGVIARGKNKVEHRVRNAASPTTTAT